jgi:hypothetical protein
MPEDLPDSTVDKQALTRFKPGQSGNPAGRPKGSRNKLGEQFLDDLLDAWNERGKAALAQCAQREPTQFCKIMAGILPREIVVAALNMNATVSISDMEETRGFLEAFRYARDKIGAVPLKLVESMEHIHEGVIVSDAWKADDDND